MWEIIKNKKSDSGHIKNVNCSSDWQKSMESKASGHIYAANPALVMVWDGHTASSQRGCNEKKVHHTVSTLSVRWFQNFLKPKVAFWAASWKNPTDGQKSHHLHLWSEMTKKSSTLKKLQPENVGCFAWKSSHNKKLASPFFQSANPLLD